MIARRRKREREQEELNTAHARKYDATRMAMRRGAHTEEGRGCGAEEYGVSKYVNWQDMIGWGAFLGRRCRLA